MNKNSKNKIQKNVELVSLLASEFESMRIGERLRVTPLAKRIILRNGSHPHKNTVQDKLDEFSLSKDIKDVRYIRKNKRVVEVEKIKLEEHDDLFIRKELRNDINLIKNEIDIIKSKLKNIPKEIKKLIR